MLACLVDTSVWVDHFRHTNAELVVLLERDVVRMHPVVIGEIASGTPPQRQHTLGDLQALQPLTQASLHETLSLIEGERLYGLGCGWVDLQLLASVLLTPGARLWTLDKHLHALAERFGVRHGALTENRTIS